MQNWSLMLNLNINRYLKLCFNIYFDLQCKLELKNIGEPVDHAEAFGRIAFSCPTNEVILYSELSILSVRIENSKFL